MNENVTYDSMMRVLPSVLKNAPSMLPLGQTAATFLELTAGSTELDAIYNKIDELPESLLDLLADDFGVIWYDADQNLETKRRVIKESFYVHRHLGTTGAVRKALSAIWPYSSIEEWFEYGGDPYMFRVILEADASGNQIIIGNIFNTIRTYQSARSHLETGMPIVRVTFGIVIETGKFNHKYHVDPVGTKKSAKNAADKIYYIPNYSTHGDKSHEDIIVETDDILAVYSTPATGETIAGSWPRVSTHGDRDDGGLYVGADSLGSTYRARPCGTSLNSLM